ncbi:citrate lyase subunit beta / citryl-CoA lyase [Rhizobium sp. RU20A]|uniref:HpcH/HpaI aldolase/citrate lyase family protein n=1 Tax=Rhizobium sp. RU20A TaxID=1907412 RepID=UPI000953DCC7|nr:CoA ester lyase [Rhizobium sp. RU20A]SIQ60496.1 citrate lyase subunit beta / citryl-CoA lyase [Rhizobium sp. RU20A]
MLSPAATHPRHPVRLRRSVLCLPADNARALAKTTTLPIDAVIYDLEDAVLPEAKAQARAMLVAHLSDGAERPFERIVRINSLHEETGRRDLMAIAPLKPDAILLPKVSGPGDIALAADLLAEMEDGDDIRLWAMIETPQGVLNVAATAEAGRTRGARLDCLVPGLNDLRKETGVPAMPGRTYLVPWLMQILLAARAAGLDIIDAVFNDFRDAAGLVAECEQGRAMGFDGKMLIHPAQIGPANAAFGVNAAERQAAEAIVAAFALPGNEDRAVITVDGRMVERLHLVEAERLLARVAAIAARTRDPDVI